MAKAIAEKVIEYLGTNNNQSTRDKLLLEIMLDNTLTEMELASNLGVSQATVSHTLQKLQVEGEVYSTKSGKRHIWHYIKKADRHGLKDKK